MADVSNTEQDFLLDILHFLVCFPITDLSGQSLASAILHFLESLGLDPDKRAGQSYFELTHPRKRGERKSHLDGPDLLTHYKTSLFIAFLDHFISELKRRFELRQNLLSHNSILVLLRLYQLIPKA
ncbi:hypothetical protein QYM36_002098 [Artemia franciscana]|uniref:Uncharacterized protein n=1 Tax=Artemia franciscana TaxID=6661 RepID=A0AA88I6D2_ARTSF|nr:hypothetical protein QYM36_002098 [Artemia franciscana]